MAVGAGPRGADGARLCGGAALTRRGGGAGSGDMWRPVCVHGGGRGHGDTGGGGAGGPRCAEFMANA